MAGAILLGLGFLISTYTDLKRREIPLWVFPSVFVIRLLMKPAPAMTNWLGMAIMGVTFLILCLSGKMGGGDLIMFSVSGFILGIDNLTGYVICMTISFCVSYIIWKYKMKDWIPAAPIAASGFFLLLIAKRAGFF